MKIETSIKPRRDGVVIAEAEGVKYVFKADDQGCMVAEIENDAHIALLLSRGDDFLPADDADFDKADALVSAIASDVDDDDVPPDDEPDMNAAPIEEPISAVSAKVPAKAAKVKK